MQTQDPRPEPAPRGPRPEPDAVEQSKHGQEAAEVDPADPPAGGDLTGPGGDPAEGKP